MKIFALSDPHLSMSESVDKPMEVFGENWKDHYIKIKEGWLDCVAEDDAVIVPGDISWALKFEDAMADLAWIDALPGRKIMLRGNHDLWWASISKLNSLFDNMDFIQNDCRVVGDIAICGSRGWNIPGASAEWTEHDDKIYAREQLRLEMSLKAAAASGAGRIFAAMHYPPLDRSGASNGFTDLLEKYGVERVIYGHVHGADAKKYAFNGEKNGIRYMLTACDQIGFRPVLIAETSADQ